MKRQYLESRYAGIGKAWLYRLLQKCFQFSSWHIAPINDRPYALDVCKTLNNYIAKSMPSHNPIVEMGCGLGDIIGSLNWKYGKVGIDLSSEVLKGARLLHPHIKFYTGTFEDVRFKKISCFIMVNFIHTIPYEEMKDSIERLLKNSCVEMFVFDTFRNNEGTEYVYSHDGKYLFGGKYKLIKKSRGFEAAHGARRYVEYWKKDKNER